MRPSVPYDRGTVLGTCGGALCPGCLADSTVHIEDLSEAAGLPQKPQCLLLIFFLILRAGGGDFSPSEITSNLGPRSGCNMLAQEPLRGRIYPQIVAERTEAGGLWSQVTVLRSLVYDPHVCYPANATPPIHIFPRMK